MTISTADKIEFICEEVASGDSRWMDTEYAEYIMSHGDRIICNGDMLVLAMEDNYMLEEFAETLLDKIENGSLLGVPLKLAQKLLN